MFQMLLVEDNSFLRDIYKVNLNERFSNSLEVSLARNGREALGRIHSGEHFHLVLMSVQLPILSGLEAASKIKKFGFPNTIVAYTYSGITEVGDALIKGDVDGFLMKKSDNISHLISFVQSYFSLKPNLV